MHVSTYPYLKNQFWFNWLLSVASHGLFTGNGHKTLSHKITRIKLLCSVTKNKDTLLLVTLTRLVNRSPTSAAFMPQWNGSALVQIMACRLFGAKPLSKPTQGYSQLDPCEQWNFNQNTSFFIHGNGNASEWKYHPLNGGHFVRGVGVGWGQLSYLYTNHDCQMYAWIHTHWIE